MVSHWKECLLWSLIALSGCQLIATQQLQGPPRPRGRIRIADMQNPVSVGGAPAQALGNWPIVPAAGPISSTVHTHIPLWREETAPLPATPSQEAVVYGNWKPEHPERPEKVDTKIDSEPQPKERVYGRLEAMLMGLPADAIDAKPSSSSEELSAPIAPGGYQNPAYSRPVSRESSAEKYGRRRISTQQVPQQFELARVNDSEPILKAISKQINESVETTTDNRRNSKNSADDNWLPLPYPYPYDTTMPAPPATSSVVPGFMQSSVVHPPVPTQPTRSTAGLLNWPTDFIDSTSLTVSTERIDGSIQGSIDRRDESVSDPVDEYKYYEDSLNSAQMHSELSVPETVPLNITRVGIPYEDRNASEEPTICVPLTVSETSLSSDSIVPQLVEVERVYCFPLPKVEIRPGHARPQVEQVTRQQEILDADMDIQPTQVAIPSDSGAGSPQRSLGTLAVLLVIAWSFRRENSI
uniref:Uncharacterized protein n=1 Tax=Drosophila melanogaster TaxID=7227 RepID=A1Z8Z8_DROME|nr:uncharacterized protein Dmel_CG13157 [Drosophila melanogaster]AAF58514.3 uncharacterized protein Dmel_CG13157 [Drosophila melanogaster]|eukprot:NP_610778.2 uncharacterized protein Dmel_CG13157 [Drosophila melanogaster]